MSLSATAVILWTLTAPELTLRLVHRSGWSLDKYEAWSAEIMAHALLTKQPTDRGSRGRESLPAV